MACDQWEQTVVVGGVKVKMLVPLMRYLSFSHVELVLSWSGIERSLRTSPAAQVLRFVRLSMMWVTKRKPAKQYTERKNKEHCA